MNEISEMDWAKAMEASFPTRPAPVIGPIAILSEEQQKQLAESIRENGRRIELAEKEHKNKMANDFLTQEEVNTILKGVAGDDLLSMTLDEFIETLNSDLKIAKYEREMLQVKIDVYNRVINMAEMVKNGK